MIDDRPIKSDPKYIQQYLQNINKVQPKPFLKKKSNPTLPCYAFNLIQTHSQSKQKNNKNNKTKAQIYQQIKQKNKEKFGQKKPPQLRMDSKEKRLNPKKMTVDYKPKKTIQIEQYKKKDHANLKNKEPISLNKDKIEYQKLLDYFNQELKNLEEQKQTFNKVAEKLKFKQTIQNQQPLFYTQVKSAVQRKLANAQIEQSLISPKTTQQKQVHRQQSKPVVQHNFSKTYSVQDIKSKLQKTTQQMQLLKTQILSPNLQIKQHRYQIFQIYLLPSFDPQVIYDYIDPNKLKYNANSYYQSALKAFNCKFQKENKQCENVNEDEQCEFKSNIKQKFIGEKRVTKYDSWTQVWIPGKQRLMANKENYKVVWLSNGDVQQDFGNTIKTYFSKAKEIYRLEYKDLPPIYYHQNTKQIWRYLQDGSREIVFANGRLQVIQRPLE